MPTITKINTPKKSPQKRAIYLDGVWALNCTLAVVERLKLVVGMELSDAEVEKIKGAQVQQKVLDKGLAILSKRLHSKSELEKKLLKANYTPEQVTGALETLTRLGYVDDVRFAKAKANAAAEYRKHGRRRAYVELVKAGVERETARRTSEEVYEAKDSMKVARELAMKRAPSLRKLDRVTAHRRLLGMLLRRGFTFDEVKPVLDEVLGKSQVDEAVNPATGEVTGPDAPAPLDAPAPPNALAAPDEPAAPGEPESTDDPDADPSQASPDNWRESLLAHHHRKKEKPPSKWRRR